MIKIVFKFQSLKWTIKLTLKLDSKFVLKIAELSYWLIIFLSYLILEYFEMTEGSQEQEIALSMEPDETRHCR